jgi:hypothetical protein
MAGSAPDFAAQYAVQNHHGNGDEYRNVLKGFFAEHADVLQVGKAQHDRQDAQGDDDRIDKTLFVSHYGIPEKPVKSKGADVGAWSRRD